MKLRTALNHELTLIFTNKGGVSAITFYLGYLLRLHELEVRDASN